MIIRQQSVWKWSRVKALMCLYFQISISNKHTMQNLSVLSWKQLPRFKLQNLSCSIDFPDNALKETLFALNNIQCRPQSIIQSTPFTPCFISKLSSKDNRGAAPLCCHIRPFSKVKPQGSRIQSKLLLGSNYLSATPMWGHTSSGPYDTSCPHLGYNLLPIGSLPWAYTMCASNCVFAYNLKY